MEPPELLLHPPGARGGGTGRELAEAEWWERFGETAYRPACP